MAKYKIMIFAPTPPPYAGPEVSTDILLSNIPKDRLDIIHVKSNVRNENWQKGKLDLSGIYKFFIIYLKVLKTLIFKNPDKIYLLLSSSKIGFLRDSVIILTSRIFRKKIIAHYRGGNFDGFFLKCGKAQKSYIRYVLRKTDCIIVQAEILKNMFGGIADLDKTVVLYNGLHSEPGVQPKTFDKEGLNLLFIGHIAFSKGFYEIICAYKNLFRKYNLKLSFAGTKRFSDKNKMSILNFLKGDNLEYYLKNNDKINNTINEFVDNSEMYNAKYLGIISGEEKKKAFDDAEILLLPSYTEGFSMTVLEALFRGIPVVVTRVGAFPEIITEGVNGFFVEAGNAAQLERSITQLVLDKEKLRLISKNNIDYAVNNFGIQKISKDFENILYNV